MRSLRSALWGLLFLLLAGCGSTAGLVRQPGTGDYLRQRDAAFGVWPDTVREITYSVAENISHLPHDDPERAVVAGVNDWGETLQGRFTFRRVGVNEPALVRFTWRKRGQINGGGLLGFLFPDQVGETHVAFGPRRVKTAAGVFAQEITGADVAMDRSQAPWMYRIVAAHEFGHALGILFEDDRDGDLMHSPVPAFVTGPRTRDKATIRALYGL